MHRKTLAIIAFIMFSIAAAGCRPAAAPVTVECEGDAGTCYEQARAVCPNGFDEIEGEITSFTGFCIAG